MSSPLFSSPFASALLTCGAWAGRSIYIPVQLYLCSAHINVRPFCDCHYLRGATSLLVSSPFASALLSAGHAPPLGLMFYIHLFTNIHLNIHAFRYCSSRRRVSPPRSSLSPFAPALFTCGAWPPSRPGVVYLHLYTYIYILHRHTNARFVIVPV